METIYILAKVDAGHAESIREKILKVAGVKFAHAVTGSYDYIISMDGDSLAKLLSHSIKHITCLEGMKSTETLVVIHLDE
jgi:DNA-binding Lrp family transcriptional regulator